MSNYDFAEVQVEGTSYIYDKRIQELIGQINQRVFQLRRTGKLSPEALKHLRQYFRIKNIHHSNAIEGNLLDYGETRLVVEEGLTITGKPLKDSLEAKNLAHAMDFFEELATKEQLLIASEIRQIHQAILKDIDNTNAGKYRESEVEISGSQFKSPLAVNVPKMMDEYCQWLEKITAITEGNTLSGDPIVLAAVAHAWFVYIHPFIDGNGRTARIIMNLVLMRYSYPIAVITKDDRHRYYDALEESQSTDLTPFISLLCDTISESLDEYEKAVADRLETVEWASSLIQKVESRKRNQLQYQFEVWRSAMDLMKGYFKETASILNTQSDEISIHFRDYDVIDFEKYLSLTHGQTTKRTWFFKIGFSVENRPFWYLFFFGFASYKMKDSISNNISVHIAREEERSYYRKLDDIGNSVVPELREIAYSHEDETFICRHGSTSLEKQKVEAFARKFITDVVNIHFLNSGRGS